MYYIGPKEEWPKPGYYYHYKHDPDGPVNNYAYFIYGIGHHTESDCRPQEMHFLNYRPLYEEAFVFKNDKMFDNRPFHMYFEAAHRHGIEVQRFTRITDSRIEWKLQEILDRMYPQYRVQAPAIL